MRGLRFLSVLVPGALVACLAWWPSIGVAAPAPPPAPAGDSVVGAGTAFGQAFSFSVRGGPDGEHPVGTVEIPALYRGAGTPTCLRAQGNRVVIGVTYANPLSSTGVGGFLISLTDNGPPSGGSPDVVNFLTLGVPSGEGAGGPAICPDPAAPPPPSVIYTGPFDVESGDIVITDAPLPPQSKDDCTDGGWRRYGFKNQGQCVASVRRGPTP